MKHLIPTKYRGSKIFKLLALTFSFLAFFNVDVKGQEVNIANTSLDTCEATIYDDGGPSGDYSDAAYEMIICSSDGSALGFSVDFIEVDSFVDMVIYQGSGTIGSALYTIDFFTDPTTTGPINVGAECLTIEFEGGFFGDAGFEISITCLEPSCDDGVQNQDETGVDCGGTFCDPCPFESSVDFCGDEVIFNGDLEATTPECQEFDTSGSGAQSEFFIDEARAEGWYGISVLADPQPNSPDYFNSTCAGNSTVECFGDNGSIGLYVQIGSGAGLGYAEYAQSQLLAPLEGQKIYCVSVEIGASSLGGGGGTDGFGIWFHNQGFIDKQIDANDEQFLGAGSTMNVIPQIMHPAGDLLALNADQCESESYCFTADGGEGYVIVGNFRPMDELSGSADYLNFDKLSVREACPLSFEVEIVNSSLDPCDDGPITLSAEVSEVIGGCGLLYPTYDWSTGETSPSIIVPAGVEDIYTVTVTLDTDCQQESVEDEYEVTTDIPDCNDDDCSTEDSYNEALCECVNTPIPPPDCDDENCTTEDTYDELNCECVYTPISPPDCDDEDCTTVDSYDELTCDCVYEPIEPDSCDDEDCNTDDSYDEMLCECVNTPITPPDCDDEDCTTVDSYDELSCECVYEPVGPDSCNDGDCTTADSYDTDLCECVYTPIPPPDCDDGDCTTVDTYDELSCECVYGPVGPDSCDDGNCNTTDMYDTDLCDCVNTPIPSPDCDDGDCTTVDSYDELSCECFYELVSPDACDDGDCNTADSYDTTLCECINTIISPPDCDDGDCITLDIYDELTCTCVYTINPNPPADCLGNVIAFPNAFTPNNDGINDQFRALTTANVIDSFELYIYNRWGQQIYATIDVNQGWDGSLNGEDALLGVYVYYANIVFIDGEAVNRQGNITLLR